MREYFYQTFPSQLARLEFLRPNNTVRENIMRDSAVVFFGGPNWDSVRADLAPIPDDDRSKFILSLFMIVITDQALHTYNRDSYDAWRAQTNYPKFGSSGFGPHNENPFKILWAPEREQIVDVDQVLAIVPQFVRFLIDETQSFFGQHIPDVDVVAYFDAIRRDTGYAFNQGMVVPAVKEQLEALTMP
ncbi:hypothetical protein EC9_29420 [Rosistilla ulvae]|uniref:Uncharacterized protein n=1 Tax=Rosistilla ulvae TaxID=1930277 RepID=A0A517M1J5_9BACT|nr:hypothetical protein [Rosistilla ulvae]QDS88748.1 hypothetical protein EC9_29420 [Rosistilla ulvae]